MYKLTCIRVITNSQLEAIVVEAEARVQRLRANWRVAQEFGDAEEPDGGQDDLELFNVVSP